MSFENVSKPGTPTWTAASNPSTAFTPLSDTGQTQILSGYGQGRYGKGLYGTGETQSISINIRVETTWTAVTDK